MKWVLTCLIALSAAGCSSSDGAMTEAVNSISEHCRSPIVFQIEATTFYKSIVVRCDDMPLTKKESK